MFSSTFFSVHEVCSKFFSSNRKRSKLITREDYPEKGLTDLKENTLIMVIGFEKNSQRPVVQKIEDYQKYLGTGKIEEESFFFPTNDLGGILSLDSGKTYKVISHNGFPSLEKVSILFTEDCILFAGG